MKRVSRGYTAIATASLLVLTACSGSDDESGSDTNADGDIVIDFWHGYGAERMEWVNEAVAQYNKMTDGVVIKPESKSDYDKLFDSVLLSAGTDAAPEIAQVVVTYTASALDSGAFRTISEADTEDKVDPDDYMPAVVGQLTRDEELTSMPWAHSAPVLFFDKGVFEKAGLDPENPPRTWPEIEDACDAIVAQEKLTEYCLGIPWDPWFVENWMAGQDAPLIDNGNGRDDDATESLLDSDAARTAFEAWKELYDDKYYPYSPEGYEFPRQMFSEGKTAMTVSSIADAAYFQGALSDQSRELGTGYFPSATDDPSVGTTLGGASLWLTEGQSPEVEQAALDFMIWLASAEKSADWAKATGYFPVNKGAEAVLEKDGYFEKNPWARISLDQLKETEVTAATSGPLHPAMPEVNNAILTALEQVLLGDASVDEALSAAAEESDAAISRMNELK